MRPQQLEAHGDDAVGLGEVPQQGVGRGDLRRVDAAVASGADGATEEIGDGRKDLRAMETLLHGQRSMGSSS